MIHLPVPLFVSAVEPPIAGETNQEPTPEVEAVSRPSTGLWRRLSGWFTGG